MSWDGVDRRDPTLAKLDLNTRDLVIETHEKVQNLCDFLLDNGQPGAISRLNNDLNNVDRRVQDLEGWRRWVNGIGAAIGTILTGVGLWWSNRS